MIAGPVEATAVGNVLVQARARGLVSGDLEALRALVRATHHLRRTSRPRRGRGGVARSSADRRPGPMRVALFITCFNDLLFPDVGKATVAVLRRLGHEVEFPDAQTCCGQMHFNTGYRDACVPLVRRFAETFAGFDAVVTPSASCAGDGPPPPRDGGRGRAATGRCPAPSRRSRRASTS